MRRGACEDCRSWEEELYWTHFQYIHFSQFLHAGFDRRLAIPEKFTRNLRKKLPDTVTLKSPGGITWEVRLTAHEDTLFFNHGWREFVEEHSLEENDMLVFKYNGESCFDVLMFDGQNMCEKAGSYFLTKCVHKGRNSNGCQTKRKTAESSTEVLSASNEGGHGGLQQKKSPNDNVYATQLRQPLISRVANKKAQREIKLKKAVGSEDLEAKADIVRTSVGISSRRLTPEEEHKLDVLKSAHSVVTSEGFIAVMKPTHVSKKFFLSIPWTWVSKHITIRENQYVILRIKEKTWQVRFYYRKKPNRGGLACGWKSFVLDNNVRECDVCVFEPGIPLDNMVVLDVNILHVVQEMTPLTPTSASL